MIVRKLEEKDFQSLIDFNTSVFDKRDKVEESIIYRFYANPLINNSSNEILIAKDKEDNIVGQILVMPSVFTFKGKEFPAFFGMDYFVKIESRKSLAGVILANKYKDLKYNFGIGLTDNSLAILSSFNVKTLGYMVKYIKPNILFSITGFLFSSIIKVHRNSNFPETIIAKEGKFKRVFSPEEICSINSCWNPNLIEFTRSKEFVNWRFFYYPDKYFVYKYLSDSGGSNLNPTYFVVRPIVWKNLNCLLLVDYRFDVRSNYMFSNILKSVIKVSKKLKMAATLTGCSLPSYDLSLRKKWFFKFGRKMEIVTKFEIEKDRNGINRDTILVTFADSDGDFYYGNNKW